MGWNFEGFSVSEAERKLHKELESYLNERASRMSEIERLIPLDGSDYIFIRTLWEKMFWRGKAIEFAEIQEEH